MRGQIAAFGVHVFTAIGAVLGFQALIEASAQRWEACFAWLGAALLVDGLDGPMARRVGVAEKLPRFSGERLDLIIDYLTYVVVPAYIVHQAGLVPAALAPAAAAIILVSSLFHFIDRDSKTKDGFFVGFPAVWNIVALYLFIFQVPPALAFAAIALLAILTFFPFKWIHPVRVQFLRPVTFVVLGAWVMAAALALMEGFPASLALQATITLSSLYMLAIGLARSLGPSRPPLLDG
jgi:phosphatidylcholine synthase